MSDCPLHSCSFGTPGEEQASSCEIACDTAGPRDNDVPCTSKREIHDFTYDGAKPVHFSRRPKNVVLFGETGVGKSSVINLLAGAEVAKTSPNLEGCTLEVTEYSFTLPGATALHVYDTVGLEEPQIGVNTFLGAITKAHRLVTSLHNSGGVDLLLFCIRAGRITAAMQRSYHLFFDILCNKQVPLAIVVTNLEQEVIMEDWWTRNEETFQQYGIHSVAHVCITTIPDRMIMYAQRRAESLRALRIMLLDIMGPASSYAPNTRNWLVTIISHLWSFVPAAKQTSLRKKRLLKKLEKDCMFSRSDAEQLGRLLTGGGSNQHRG